MSITVELRCRRLRDHPAICKVVNVTTKCLVVWPQGDLSAFPPDSEEQQAAVLAVAEEDAYNWGYAPKHMNTEPLRVGFCCCTH